MTRTLAHTISCLAVLAALQSAASAQTAIPSVIPAAGKLTCGSGSGQIGSTTANLKVCLQRSAGIGRDTYSFLINDKSALQVADDDSLKGVSGTYEKTPLFLNCTSQTKPPKEVSEIMIRTYQRTMKVSAEQAREMAIKQDSIEIGRQCAARANNKVVLEVQFKFE